MTHSVKLTNKISNLLIKEFNALVASNDFPATQEVGGEVVPTTVEDFMERQLRLQALSWKKRDDEVSVAELRPLLEEATSAKLAEVKALLQA